MNRGVLSFSRLWIASTIGFGLSIAPVQAVTRAEKISPVLRGTGDHQEMLLSGRVLDARGNPASDFEISVEQRTESERGRLKVQATGHRFEVWVPVGIPDWFYIELTASTEDGAFLAFEGISMDALRQASLDGIDLTLMPTDRTINVTVEHDGTPVSEAHVNLQVHGNAVLGGTTNDAGQTSFQLRKSDRIRQLTAWTDDFRIGGYSFSRKPRRDPLGSEFAVELNSCRSQKFRFVTEDDSQPVEMVPFAVQLGTGAPNYNFVAVADTFPDCRMTTDDKGEATCHWFPDWPTHGAYVDLGGKEWAAAKRSSEWDVATDGTLVMPLKHRVKRQTLVGKVSAETGISLSGLLIQIRSFQGEQEGYSDYLHAFTDEAGNFSAACIPGATYCVCVNDFRVVSNIIDLIPCEADTGRRNPIELKASVGAPVEIRLTAGSGYEPIRRQWVHLRTEHDYTWFEDGEERRGGGGRSWTVRTDDQGIARTYAPADSELVASVNAGAWRSGQKKIKVTKDAMSTLEIHREVAETQTVNGRLIPPDGQKVAIANAEVVLGSIGGETDERQATKTDAMGRFSITTRAKRFGIFAYTVDGRAAGSTRADDGNNPIELQLQPTCDFHGRLLAKEDKPVANHAVRTRAVISGKRDYSKSFATSFVAREFRTTTDKNGNYTLKNLPSELEMNLRADRIDGASGDASLEDFYLVHGELRPRTISYLERSTPKGKQSLSTKYHAELRDAKLGDFNLLVMIYHSSSEDFVGKHVTNRRIIPEVSSYLNLRINQEVDHSAKQFLDSMNWPEPAHGVVVLYAINGDGDVLSQTKIDVKADNASAVPAEFVRTHAPPRNDAELKWKAALAEAKRSNRRLWARIGQRYCGPCFMLSRWIDDNQETLERDYVLLKIDNVRDQHGIDIANLIVSGRERFGVPFHAIFDASGKMLIDSEGHTGNIGHPSGFEGRKHLSQMLMQTKRNLSDNDVESLVNSLD